MSVVTSQPVTAANPTAAARRKARFRSLVWPGAGFAYLGWPGLAALGSMFVLLALLGVFYFSYTLTPPGLYLIVACMGACVLFWVVEYVAVGSMTLAPTSRANPLKDDFLPCCVAAYGAVALTGLIFFLNVGALRLNGSGMAPTIRRDELLLYRRGYVPPDLKRGRLIVFNTRESAWGPRASPFVARILAVPGDKLSISGKRYRLNGKDSRLVTSSVKGLAQVIVVPKAPDVLTIPEGCNFVVQDDAEAYDSRAMAWARRDDIVSAYLVLYSRRAFGKVLE